MTTAPEMEPEIEPVDEFEPESEVEPEAEPVAEETPVALETENPPAAMPSVGAADVFIPPEPASTAETNAGDDCAPETVDIGEAEEDDAEQAAEAPKAHIPWRVKGVSLFERVTGTGKAAFGKKEVDPEPVEIKEVSSLGEPPVSEPVGEPEAPAEQAEQPEETNVTSLNLSTEEAEDRQSLGGMDENERLPASENTDDLLDIPAFLRRQAN